MLTQNGANAEAAPSLTSAALSALISKGSPRDWVALAAGLRASRLPIKLTDADAAAIAHGATARCALARAVILAAAGRKSNAQALRREAPFLAANRKSRIALSLKAAAKDVDFRSRAADGDRARDSGNMEAAESAYRGALHLFPLHPGYRVQLAHMIKDQGHFMLAEIQYRTALALYAPFDDVYPHLSYVCEQQGYFGAINPVSAPSDGADPMEDPPTEMDIDTLAYIFWHDAGLANDEYVELLREQTTCKDVAIAMTTSERFQRRSRQFLEIIRESR